MMIMRVMMMMLEIAPAQNGINRHKNGKEGGSAPHGEREKRGEGSHVNLTPFEMHGRAHDFERASLSLSRSVTVTTRHAHTWPAMNGWLKQFGGRVSEKEGGKLRATAAAGEAEANGFKIESQ